MDITKLVLPFLNFENARKMSKKRTNFIEVGAGVYSSVLSANFRNLWFSGWILFVTIFLPRHVFYVVIDLVRFNSGQE
jgi:hypothetical protein